MTLGFLVIRLLVESRMGLNEPAMLDEVHHVAPINEFHHHVIFQNGARITGSFPSCSLHGEDDRTMAEERVKGLRKMEEGEEERAT